MRGWGNIFGILTKSGKNTCGECCFIKVGRLAIAFTKTFFGWCPLGFLPTLNLFALVNFRI